MKWLYMRIDIRLIACLLLCFSCIEGRSQQAAQAAKWYEYDPNAVTRWSSPENPNGEKGAGGKTNAGAKGRPFYPVEAGGSLTLLDVQGAGIINRIWITVNDRSPEMLRSLKLEIFWDNAAKPAVSVPLGDFFGVGLGKTAAFQNALFADPEGRSFNCFIPMPFKKAARIKVTNESNKELSHLFFDVDFQSLKTAPADFLYFHAYWNRDTATTLARDFELLPLVHGKGRFLGVNVGINANPLYGEAWWGEGEVKMYLDGDKAFPSLAGTGSEDYIGTGWGQGQFIHQYSGCPIADAGKKQWAYYRYHIPDPIFFETDCKVTIQQMGGDRKEKVLAMQRAGVPLIPVLFDNGSENPVLLYQDKRRLDDPSIPEGWANFYRSDDVSATAYFYLDSPVDDLPPLQPLAMRVHNLK